MNIVLDTNALLVSIPSKSVYRTILEALLNGKFNLILSNEILYEYTEIIERKASILVVIISLKCSLISKI